MNFERIFVFLFKSLISGLALSCSFSFSLFSQQVQSNKLLGIRAGNKSWTYLDTTFQYKLPDWRREESGNAVQLNYALQNVDKEMVLFLDFERRMSLKNLAELEFVYINEDDSLFLAFQRIDSNTVKLKVREPIVGFAELLIFRKTQLIGRLEVDVISQRKERLYVVPLFEIDLDEKKLQSSINKVLRSYHLSIEVSVLPGFFAEDLEKNPFMDNPSPEFDHYTRQMRHIRDDYFENFPNSDRKAYYVFLHRGFVNEDIKGYASKGKAMSFVKNQKIDAMAYHIAVQLVRGIGSLNEPEVNENELPTGENLLSAKGGRDLNPEQWKKLHLDFRGYPYFDEDEEVNSFNGFVAYYFWEENEDGTIVFEPGAFRRAVQRPYKKNYFSYHLSVDKWIFKPLFSWMDYPLSPLHLLLFGLYILIALYLRWKWMRRITDIAYGALKIRKWLIRVVLAFGIFSLTVVTFSTINRVLARYEIYDGRIPDFEGMSIQEVRKQILYNVDILRSDVPEMSSEVLIKRGEEWIVKRRKRVLYFDMHKDSSGIYSVVRFSRESDSIIVETEGIKLLAPSHYLVVNRIDENLNFESQTVLNHQGSNVTNLLKLHDDPAKRVLLFVNGYRPTSFGNSLEENFRDIREQGIEHPDSKNMIYDFDRYDYWRPWREIDIKFEKRINPSEIYYADGHFSVNTSNYRSLIHFTEVSARYPTRCKDPNHHTCQNQGSTSWFRSSDDATFHLLPNRPNHSGFKRRKENGRIAGLNLLQQLNEIPNSSGNDTLYIVAHSMGYAYALGMIEELRGKINYGGFYILAPENASIGRVDPSEWKEIWQYGVNHEAFKKHAPCMLDGVAPQKRAKGLDEDHQVFIPVHLYQRFGFFDSHFVGFYDWIFDLKKGENGSILQR